MSESVKQQHRDAMLRRQQYDHERRVRQNRETTRLRRLHREAVKRTEEVRLRLIAVAMEK